jgi:hypothetical protein
MNKAGLALIFIFSLSLIHAQTYVPISFDNSYWNEIKEYQGICDPPDFCRYTYFFQGDTVIDAESYHKLYSNDSLSVSYVGGMREIDQKVYFYYKECSNPVLLYDFGLNAGDTIPLACELCYFDGPLSMMVTSVDSVFIEGTGYRKRINFDYSQSWIEGIGSTAGLLYPYYSCFTCTCFLELVCFEQDGLTLYRNEDFMSCFNYAGPGNNLDPASEWRVNYQMSFYPGDFYNNLYRDFIDGDTIINSIKYNKIYSSGYSYEGVFPTGDIHYFDHLLHGFLRAENNKWYTYYENQDALLYDFTLEINDTVYSAYTDFIDGPVSVTDIDSVLVGGENKKRLHLNGYGAESIIEDIGATSGLFENMVFFEWYSDLVCFAKDGISLWGESTEECDLAVQIDEQKNNVPTFTIYPNPAEDYTLISFPPGSGKAKKISILDSYGRIVFQKSEESNPELIIPLYCYRPGLYLVLIENGHQRQFIKLLVK